MLLLKRKPRNISLKYKPIQDKLFESDFDKMILKELGSFYNKENNG